LNIPLNQLITGETGIAAVMWPHNTSLLISEAISNNDYPKSLQVRWHPLDHLRSLSYFSALLRCGYIVQPVIVKTSRLHLRINNYNTVSTTCR